MHKKGKEDLKLYREMFKIKKDHLLSPPTSSPLQRQPLSTFLAHSSSKILKHVTVYICICFKNIQLRLFYIEIYI